ncbi:MAG: cytochrome c oxidase subunit II [Solirubrobacterales bacterium]
MKASHRIVGIVISLAVTAGLIAFTFAYDWFGPLISENDGKIDSVYRWLLVASIPFFVIICAMIAFCVIEFRVKSDDPNEEDGAPFHGSTRIEIIWTVIPTIVVLALGVYAWMVLDDVEAREPNELKIQVVGQQFAWNFKYPSLGIETNGDLIVPKDRALFFEMTSADVIHSFYVPNARMKRDVADGFTSRLNFRPDKLGAYPIVCTELCGIGHATMRSTLRVVTPAAFAHWVAAKKAAGDSKSTGAISSTVEGSSASSSTTGAK